MNLKVEHLQVSIKKKTILQDISFHLEEGWWLTLAGPNGAGKTTLLRAVSRAIPSSGKLLLSGMDMRKMRPGLIARYIGFMEQMVPPSFAFTVEEVVAMGRYAHRQGLFNTDPDGERAIAHALEITSLEKLRNQTVLSLSGGEMQRVMLAQVLCQEPNILFLDEPANHLDLKYQKELFDLINEWRKQPGHAVLSVVHDLSLGRMYASHALVLKDGKQLVFGNAEEALSPRILNKAWDMDVPAWFRALFAPWQKDS